MLGLMAVLATTAGLMTVENWNEHYQSWASVQGLGAKVGVFIQGCSTFLESLGIERYTGASFVSLVVVSYALTSLDSATRLLRYNVEEIAETIGVQVLGNRYVSTLIAVAAIGFFAFYEIDGKSAGLTLWALFGTTNQLLAGLALLAVTVYLLLRGKPWYYTGVPMVAMLVTTIVAMVSNATRFAEKSQWLLFAVGVVLLLLALWLVVEAAVAVGRARREGKFTGSLDIDV
jgi:carbon starvation protein